MKNFTDEEILSYLIKDCSQELNVKINKALNESIEFKNRVEELELLRRGIQFAPFDTSTHSSIQPFWKNAIQISSFAIIAFIIGLFVESRYLIIKSNIDTPAPMTMEKSVSKQLTWDEHHLSKLM